MTGIEEQTRTGHAYEVRGSTEHFRGRVFSVHTDEVAMPGGQVAARDYVAHIGAVAVVALDGQDRVVLVRQYRHAVRRRLWELPAGLVDVAGEDLAQVAARELAEEADLRPGRLDVLLDLHSSAGYSTEFVRVFLARELTDVPAADRYERRDEEADMAVARVDLDEAVRLAAAGEITNAACVAGVLAAARARDAGWATLRPADAPLPG
ncbi:MAG TPA: NUDIX hydrolase [Pilimelia sp.]|nr:NUDIX hydrolase [Pilimelia sp.]